MKLLFVVTTFFPLFRVTKQQLSFQRDSSTKLSFGSFLHLHGYRLNVTANETLEVAKEIKCTSTCLRKQDCFSFNIKKKASESFLCELLNSSIYVYPEELEQDNNYVHWYLQNPCLPSPCNRGTICNPVKYKTAGYLCEGFDPTNNFALKKPTTQSSLYLNAISGLAVDGDRTTLFRVDNIVRCTHTTLIPLPAWWRVDFEKQIPVARVVITNRADYGYRLHDFEIKIGSSLVDDGRVNPKCGNRHSVGAGLTETIMCSPALTGRYLLIESFLNDILTICELEIYTGP